jgi:heme exporter protein A
MLYRTLSGRENLQFFARLYGLENVKLRIEKMLQRVGLVDDADRPISEYSRGMAQRLTLARALMPEPKVLLLDEPFTGLDQNGIHLAESLIAEQKARGAFILLVSHDLEVAQRVADRCLVLQRGRLRFHGDIGADIRRTYQSALAGGGMQ